MLESLLPETFQWWHMLFLFAASLCGESFGTLIGGGSLVTQPALLMTGLPLNTVIATDHAGQLGAEAGIISETKREIRSRWRLILLMSLPIVLGGTLGVHLLINSAVAIIKPIMITVLLLLLVHGFFLKGRLKFLGLRRWRYPFLFVFLFIIGVYTSFIGVGEGTFFRLGIMLLMGLSFMQSHGLRAAAVLPISFYVLVVAGAAGLIAWPYLLAMWAGGFLASRYVTRHMRKIPERYTLPSMTGLSLLFITYLILFV